MNLRRISIMFALALAMLACEVGLPGGVVPDAEQPQNEQPAGQELPSPTASVDALVEPSATATDTATPEILTETPTPLPSNTPLPSATLTLTSTAPPGVPLDAFDPREGYGDPDLLDFFNDYANWNQRNDNEVVAQITDGKFLLTAKTPNLGTRWVHSWPEINDYYLEVIAYTPEVCEGLDRYGLYFRGPETTAGHIFEVSCDGRYRYWIWNGASGTTIVNWKEHSAIVKGGNQVNVLAVKSVDDLITLYVNGEEIDVKTVDRYSGRNYIGLSIGTGVTENFTVQFDNFAYWLLDD